MKFACKVGVAGPAPSICTDLHHSRGLTCQNTVQRVDRNGNNSSDFPVKLAKSLDSSTLIPASNEFRRSAAPLCTAVAPYKTLEMLIPGRGCPPDRYRATLARNCKARTRFWSWVFHFHGERCSNLFNCSLLTASSQEPPVEFRLGSIPNTRRERGATRDSALHALAGGHTHI